ncbi:phenylalanine--tRNA ligase subunit alpha [Phycisphaera mikurensis]|uniref:Phenylalanine--tRNA ligase alpha subunit n=1 Tax=Phycisphaera mikurensis (strain NBRC 102666 / KCTC 22515 / FYK2301M01) TaxID=1142394 RepID=I0IG43_PHYMF|nr:phenylalanine--tRNA ligase subunit alpha [Phycisphaera mikurensis]MBB6440387.1 phenylalanyl-tRNA synthetase alpha chain [Phycisphaera mikurensis]BAM04231.1 phenylalanyl-tRNA synthetase alpha chain [Phycisphaera mikurensis NBRC 102666]
MVETVERVVERAEADLAGVADAAGLERFRAAWLGPKGEMKKLLGGIGGVPAADRRAFGQAANAARQKLQEAFEARREALGGSVKTKRSGPPLDLTLPPILPETGRRHVISQTVDELLEVFGRMGFDVAEGPELEDDRHNFVALNIPESHPARDPLDNFYVAEEGVAPGFSTSLMRSQTSTVQIRVLEHTKPPVRIVSTGRVYRPDEHDATHTSMFHQIEGLCVDRGVTMVDLKTTLIQFAKAVFGADAEVKLVPSYFPFTEPSAELYVKMDFGKGPEWMEIGGCGMVDPAVLGHVDVDPEEWTGFAFGLGIERLVMRKHDIADIRWLYENDRRFLRRF